jgi:NAD(P)-dependent dehydrogenase (short-subunit alcohol dehydrogenase family)
MTLRKGELMARTYIVTGSASGIGLVTCQLLQKQGERVIGVDIHDADIVADLSTAEGRQEAVSKSIELSNGSIDVLIANAGLALPISKTVSVNFFGVTDLVNGLRPTLSKSKSPRVVVTSSMASLMPNDPELVDLMLNNDETAALARAEALVTQGGGLEQLIYGSTKRAISRWIRKVAPLSEFAGAGIPINAIGPGIVVTPMTQDMIATEEAKAGLLQIVPMPLNGIMGPEVIAKALIWLAGEENSHMTGQTIYIDGGSDVVLRGEDIWS